jgi:ribosome-associated protein
VYDAAALSVKVAPVRFDIPDSELVWKFSPTGGPGGQHANKSSTRVELRFDVASSGVFDDQMRARVTATLGNEVRITEDRSRSQATNRKRALRRLDALLDGATKPDPPKRRPTKPTRSARRRRVEAKRRRSEVKSFRKNPPFDD